MITFVLSFVYTHRQPTPLPQLLLFLATTRWDLAPIQEAVQYYFTNALAPSTQKCYNAGQQHYIQFCTQADLIPIPTSENTLSLFAAYLARSGLAYSTTVKVYFSSVGNLHLSCIQHIAYQTALTPRLEQILRGIKREQAFTCSARIRLPITIDIMHKIYDVLSKTPTKYQEIMLWAARCTAFFFWIPESWRDDCSKPAGI